MPLLLGAVLAARAGAQAEAPAEVDPYTEGEPEAMERAGYVSFGPFPWGDGHGTDEIEETLGGIAVLWVETEHFRIGSSLGEYAVPSTDRTERDRIRDELKRLKERLRGVDARAKTLDPWLRLHLLAQRLEELYADFAERLALAGVDFAAVPATGLEQVAVQGADWRGTGPYLGQAGKPTVLVLARSSSFARYVSRWIGGPGEISRRWYFAETGSLFYGTSADFLEGPFRSDSSLACHVAYGVAQNLADGFRGFLFPAPDWLREGLAQWFSRRVDPRWGPFNGLSPAQILEDEKWRWEERVKARVGFRFYPKHEEILGWGEPPTWRGVDRMMLWSRIDFLMESEDEGLLGALLWALKEPLPPSSAQPLGEVLRRREAEALPRLFGFDAAGFDEAWSEWVERAYRSR